MRRRSVVAAVVKIHSELRRNVVFNEGKYRDYLLRYYRYLIHCFRYLDGNSVERVKLRSPVKRRIARILASKLSKEKDGLVCEEFVRGDFLLGFLSPLFPFWLALFFLRRRI